jgi:hypothetical protein
MGKAEICPEVFRSELVEVYLSLDTVEYFTDLDFDLFGFRTFNILLACKATDINPGLLLLEHIFDFMVKLSKLLKSCPTGISYLASLKD